MYYYLICLRTQGWYWDLLSNKLNLSAWPSKYSNSNLLNSPLRPSSTPFPHFAPWMPHLHIDWHHATLNWCLIVMWGNVLSTVRGTQYGFSKCQLLSVFLFHNTTWGPQRQDLHGWLPRKKREWSLCNMLQETEIWLFLACGQFSFYHDYYSWIKIWCKAYLSIDILQTILLTDGDQLLPV